MFKITSTTTTVRRTFKYSNGITYHDCVSTTGKSVSIEEQYFTVSGSDKKFHYFPHVLAHLAEITQSGDTNEFWETATIQHPETFDEFEHLWNYSIGLDGFMYHIWSKTPVPITQFLDYCGGFTNEDYDLDMVLAQLKLVPWIANAEIKPIPYYNASETRTLGISFQYRIPYDLCAKLWKKYKTSQFPSCRIKEELFGLGLSDPLKLRQYQKQPHELS